ncbi:hypothetical protein [Streptomyces albipurpureus]|uniref:Uncharacterized protein n=1 Tax=Streptomyces albipurpureus TaxID=2897419 RepID=A0ABT0UPC1_9ACTN|nr:hypothetical protein [Streptomyces sp. CWNU-1]MCM2390285.1 hypothetical protein [Streptomyces sp. CWNU-1]
MDAPVACEHMAWIIREFRYQDAHDVRQALRAPHQVATPGAGDTPLPALAAWFDRRICATEVRHVRALG